MKTPSNTHPSKHTHLVTINETNQTFLCPEDVDVLTAMQCSHCQGIPVGCCNGGCGACRVRIKSGKYETGKMSAAVIDMKERATGWTLACKTYPRSDISVQVMGRAWQPAAVYAKASFGSSFQAKTMKPTNPKRST